MPYIQTRTNIAVSEEKEAAVKEKLGEAISLLGKSESWLMVEFEENCHLYFRGEKASPLAFVDIRLFGKAGRDAYAKMTARVTEIIEEELSIPGDSIYVQYQEVDHWGYNGNNF